MKFPPAILPGLLLLGAVQFASTGCATEGYASESVYYGPRHRDPWFHDDPWMDNRRWYHDDPAPSASVGIYIHPPRSR